MEITKDAEGRMKSRLVLTGGGGDENTLKQEKRGGGDRSKKKEKREREDPIMDHKGGTLLTMLRAIAAK